MSSDVRNGFSTILDKKKGVPRVAVATLGCKVNQCESATLEAALAERGFTVAPFSTAADCYIINTCTVTGRTDYQSRQLIRRLARRNPGALIVVTGCYAETRGSDLAAIPGVTAVVGNTRKEMIPQIVTELWTQRSDDGGAVEGCGAKDCREREDRTSDHTRAFLKIQDGCDAFCSYCIVPYARGRSRSTPLEEVFRQIGLLAVAGRQEVVLTGIHLGCYGQDLDPPAGLADVVRWTEAQRLLERVRLSSVEPREVTPELIDLLGTSAILCPHLHIPLQSGDDGVLQQMKRNYDASFFRALVERVVAASPDIAVGLDVMVGFPGEDERAFDHTCRLIAEMPVAYLHVFPYSPREGTEAFRMAGQVREEIKKKRAEILRALGQEKRRIFMGRFVGRRLHVLLENRLDGQTGLMKGYSRNYIPVMVENADPSLVNTVVPVMAERMAGNGLQGRIVRE